MPLWRLSWHFLTACRYASFTIRWIGTIGLGANFGFNQKAGTAYACNAISTDGGHPLRRDAGSSAMRSAERLYCRSRQIGGTAVGAKLVVAAVHGETWTSLERPRSAAA